MIKLDPQINKNKCNKCPSIKFLLGLSFAIREGLLRINKGLVIENENGYRFQNGSNENGYRFHSYDSQVFLTTRTQSATIARSLVSLVLYIYKKWNCVESLTKTRWTLTGLKVFANMGTYITQQAY